jgi:hypothetical protein
MRTRRPFEETTVPADRSKGEIRAMLLKYGVDQFGVLEEPGRALIGFRHQGRTYRIDVPLPTPEKPALAPPRSRAAPDQKAARARYEQEERRIWRVVRAWILGQLEAVESGFKTFEEVFLADTVLTNGQTFFTWAAPQLEHQADSGQLPALLPENR